MKFIALFESVNNVNVYLVMNLLTAKFINNLVSFEIWLRTRLKELKLNFIKINLKM